MRFLAPLIAAVALSGCSNNDKTQKPTATPLIPKDGGKPPVVPESAEDPVKQACACNHKHCGGNPEKKNEMGKMPPVIPAPKDAAILIVANQSEDPIPQQQPVHNIAARQAGNFSAQPQAVVIVENHTTHATQPQTAVIVENHPTEDAQTMDINNTIANRTAVVIPQQQPVNVIAATLTTHVAQPQAVVIVAKQTQPQAINNTVANEKAVVITQQQPVNVIAATLTTNVAQQQAINNTEANESTVVSVSAATGPGIGENTSESASASAQAEDNIVRDNGNGPIISPIAPQPVDPQASASAANIPTPVNTAAPVVSEVVPQRSNSLIPEHGINTEQFDASRPGNV